MPQPSLVFEIEGPPKTKKNHLETKKKTKQIYVPKDLIEYEEHVHMVATEAMKKAGWPGPWAGRVTVAMDVRFRSWHETDVPNFWDSVLDGMSGAVYDDDTQIDRDFQCRQKSSKDPGITVYVWFHDFDLNELGTRRPREWQDLTCADFDFPEVYPIVHSPEECNNPCRYAEYGIGRKKIERGSKPVRKRRPRTVKKPAAKKGSASHVADKRSKNGKAANSGSRKRR